MAFNLGNFAVKEVIYGVASDFNGNILYTLDQLTSAEIAVEADSTEITDKNGAVIRTIYNAKTATVSATSALLSPAILNAQSGSDAKLGEQEMPGIIVLKAGASKVIDGIKADEGISVIGLYPNGANGVVLTKGSTASLEDKTFGFDDETGTITLPEKAADEDAPQYLVKYTRTIDGMSMANRSDEFPSTISLLFYAAVMDPCDDKYKAAYILIPSFTPDPSVTISLDSDSQEVDYSGNVNVDYCGDEGKVLYRIFFPDEEAVTSGNVQ